jgi:hypothetical protein
MPSQVTGTGLLSLVADFGSEAPKSQLVAAAGYIKPDGKLSWTAFYEALLDAKQLRWEANLRHDYTEVEYDGAVYVFSDNF